MVKLTEKRLCDLCQNVSKVEMLQSGSGVSDKVFKGVKKVKAKVEDLTSEGRKILKDSVKLFNKGKASVEEVVRNVKPFVENVIFKKGKGFTSADFSESVGSGGVLAGKGDIPLGSAFSQGQGIYRAGTPTRRIGSGGVLAGHSTSGSGGKLAGDNKRGCGSAISSTHSVVKKGRGANPWIEHLKKFRASNPGMSYKDAMSKAKLTYKKK
jgi:hypothetical protein